VERREPILLPRVRIGAALQEKPYRRAVADGHGRMNRRYTQWIFCGRVHVRAALDQLAGELRMAKENRQADRRKTVVAQSVQQRRIFVQIRHRRRIAERASLVK